MRKISIVIFAVLFFVSCKSIETEDSAPLLYDYEGITVPVNISPLSFALKDSVDKRILSIRYSIEGGRAVSSRAISPRRWHKLLHDAAGKSIDIRITSGKGRKRVLYKPFKIFVSADKIDPYIAYRLIEPGYEIWNEMGIYQRSLESFRQSPIIENKNMDYNCVNCHSFSSYNPSVFLFHARAACGGTYIVNGKEIEKLNTKTPETVSALVYPQWHPSGKYVAFSVNNTKQRFHISDENRIEVFDYCSDIVVYDVEKHVVKSCPQIKSPEYFETFPTFSPSGDKIYFCRADSLEMPLNYDNIHYSLCSIDFDSENCSFSDTIDVLYDAHGENAGSVSFPRISPDGKYLMFTLSEYGNFSIWHKDADLLLMDLSNGNVRRLDEINSQDVESYHSWSSNSKWVVFSSRREDKLYTRLYFSHLEEDGSFSKPFILPQQNPFYYQKLLKSYNIPEFISAPVRANKNRIRNIAKNNEGINISFSR